MPPLSAQTFAIRLQATMTARKKSTPELANEVEVSFEMARRYLAGQGQPCWERLVKMAKWLNVEPNWLRDGEDMRQVPQIDATFNSQISGCHPIIHQSNKFNISKSRTNPANNPDKVAFSTRLGTTMTGQGKSIPDLAKAASVGEAMARHYVSGTGQPPRSKIAKIARWLKVDPGWLWSGKCDATKNPKDATVPIFDLSAKNMPMDHIERVYPLKECLFIVRIGNPMGSGLKHGDIAFIGGAEFEPNDKVLIKTTAPKSFITHMIRTVKYDKKMQPYFVSDDSEYPDVSSNDYVSIGKVIAVLADT